MNFFRSLIVITLSLTVIASILNNQIDPGSVIYADDLNKMFEQVEQAVTNNSDITNFSFPDYVTGEEILISKTSIGILTKLYMITELYPNGNELDSFLGYKDSNGNTVGDILTGNSINSEELNALFSKVITDVNDYTAQISGNSNISYAIGLNHGCRIENSTLYCWGQNTDRQLGIGNSGDKNVMTQVPLPINDEPKSIFLGSSSIGTCVQTENTINSSSGIYCWGKNQYGQVGDSGTTDVDSPVNVTTTFLGGIPANETIVKMEDLRDLRCLLTSGQKVYCIGYNINLYMYYPTLTRLTRHDGSELLAKDITLGGQHICVIDNTDNTLCFGSNSGGQLGDSSLATSFYKVYQFQPWITSVVPSGVIFKEIHGGLQGNCAIATNDDVYCWGYYMSGAGGTGRSPSEPEKITLPQGVSVVKLDVGNTFACFFCDDTKFILLGKKSKWRISSSQL